MAQYPPQPDTGGIQQEADPVALAALAGLTPASIGAATPSQVASAVAGVTPASLGVPTTSDLTNAIAPLATTASVSAAVAGVTPASLGVPVLAATSSQIIQAQAATVVPLVAQSAASQSANIFEARDSAGVVKASVTAVGGIVSAGNVQAQSFFASTAVRTSVLQTAVNGTNVATLGTNPRLLVAALAAGEVPLVSKGAASQTGDLQQWQDSTAAVKSSINSFGSALLRTTAQFGTAALSVAAPSATSEGVVVRGAASQSNDLQQWQDSAGNVKALISSSGAGALAQLSVGVAGAPGQIATQAASAATVASVARAATSQTADIQQWQSSAGTVLARVSSGGALTTASSLSVGTATTGYAQAYIVNGAPSAFGAAVRANASQSVDVFRVENSGGGGLFAVQSSGYVQASQGMTINNNVRLGLASGQADSAGGLGVVALANAVTSPTGTPAGGGVLLAVGGALFWKGSAGSLTQIAPA